MKMKASAFQRAKGKPKLRESAGDDSTLVYLFICFNSERIA